MIGRRTIQVAFAVSISACGDWDLPEVQPLSPLSTEPARASSTEATLPTSPHARALAHLDSCIGSSSLRVLDSWARLQLDVGPQTGEPKRGRTDRQPYVRPIHDAWTPCRALGEEDIAALPADLHRAFDLYHAEGEIIAHLATQLNPYFDGRGYEQDDWQFSQAIVPLLDRAIARWTPSWIELDAGLVAAREALAIADLATWSAQPEQGDPIIPLLAAAYRLHRCVDSRPETKDACIEMLEAFRGARVALAKLNRERSEQARPTFWATTVEREAEALERASEEALSSRRPVSDATRSKVAVLRRRLALSVDLLRETAAWPSLL